MYYHHWYPNYDLYYHRLYPSSAQIALSAENRVLNREMDGLMRENIRLRTQIIERDYKQLEIDHKADIGLSKEGKLERQKYLLKQKRDLEKGETNKKTAPCQERKLQRDYSFGSLQKNHVADKKNITTNNAGSHDRYRSLELKEKKFEENNKNYDRNTSPKRYKYLNYSTFIEGLQQEKLNPEKNVQTPDKKRDFPPPAHLISDVISEEYYNEQQANSGKKNNIPYLYQEEKSQERSPYKKFKQINSTGRKKNSNNEKSPQRQSTTNKKQFLTIFSRVLEQVRHKEPEKQGQKE